MSEPITFQTRGWASGNVTLTGYVNDDKTGTNIVPSTVSAISYTVTKASPGTTAVGIVTSPAPTGNSLSPVSSFLFAALSLVGWTVDQIGWNFQATLPASCFPEAGDYVIDVIGTLAADSTTFVLAKCYHHAKSRS